MPQHTPTFITIAHSVEVHIEIIAVEEQEGQPGVEGVYGHEQENTHYPTLLRGMTVAPQVLVHLPINNIPAFKQIFF